MNAKQKFTAICKHLLASKNPASTYAVDQSVINANDSKGAEVLVTPYNWLDIQHVDTENLNDAWFEMALTTLAIWADDPRMWEGNGFTPQQIRGFMRAMDNIDRRTGRVTELETQVERDEPEAELETSFRCTDPRDWPRPTVCRRFTYAFCPPIAYVWHLIQFSDTETKRVYMRDHVALVTWRQYVDIDAIQQRRMTRGRAFVLPA